MNEYFADKYLEQDQLSARCGAELAIQAYEVDTGQDIAMPEALIGKTIEVGFLFLCGYSYTIFYVHHFLCAHFHLVHRMSPPPPPPLQVVVINGALAPDGKLPSSFDLNNTDQVLTTHSEGQPLLLPGVGARHNARHGVQLDLQESFLHQLPRIAITKSSESLLSGRKATFRLVAHVVDDTSVVPAVSAPFVVCGFVINMCNVGIWRGVCVCFVAGERGCVGVCG